MINFNDKFGVVVNDFDEYKTVLEFLFDKGYEWFGYSHFGIGEPHKLNKEEIFDGVLDEEYIIITFNGEDDVIGWFATESQHNEYNNIYKKYTIIDFEEFTHDPEFIKYLEKTKDGKDSPVNDEIEPKKIVSVLELPDDLVKILEDIHENSDYPLYELVNLESSKQKQLTNITNTNDEHLILAYLSGDNSIVLSSIDDSSDKYILVGTDNGGDDYFLSVSDGVFGTTYDVDFALSGTKEELEDYKSNILEYQPISKYL